MKDYHSKVNILYSRKYNGNGYRLLVQQFMESFRWTSISYDLQWILSLEAKGKWNEKIFLSVYFPAYLLYNMYTWRHEILVTALSKSQSLLVIGTVNPVLSPPYQISPPF